MPASSSSPLTKPLLAGLGAALALVVITGALSFLASGEPEPVGARADITRPAPAEESALASVQIPERAPVFENSAGDEDISLPGVIDTEAALNAQPQTAAPARRTGPQAPLPGLFEAGPGGPLPVIAADGRRPDGAYAKPYEGDARAPALSIIIGGLGLSARLTERAIETLPPEVTLSFAPYSENLQDWIDRARAAGHEVLIELPMEPFDYPNNDPGPHTLLADASAQENQRRLAWLLSRAAGYAGVTNYLGARLGAAQGPLTVIFEALEDRGLSIFHDGAGRRAVLTSAGQAAGARLALADRLLDADPVPAAIDERLLELEALALQNADALGAGFAYPATVETVAAWAQSLGSRGYRLVPATHLMERRRQRDEGET